MLNLTSEKQMHRVRWILIIGWFLIIFSLFYDPLTPMLTDPANVTSPIHLDPNVCVQVQGECLVEKPYAIGNRVFWGVIVPASIFILFVFGHELWRRICPLSFISQLPRSLGWQRKMTKTNAKTGKTTSNTIRVSQDSWLGKNHLYLQLGLFFIGLCIRHLFVNADRLALGIFLLVTIAASVLVGYLFDGKSWCQYFCPMAPVQKVYSEPRALLNSTAHDVESKITQSMCRTIQPDGKEQSACVACQSPCVDIDAERTYWDTLKNPQQRVLYYVYFGLTLGFYVYSYLYTGGWDYYFSGAWTHDEHQIAHLFDPGLYLFGRAVPIPKFEAVPLVLGGFAFVSYWIGLQLEKYLRVYYVKKRITASPELIRHQAFTLFTVVVFNVFFIFAGRSNLSLFPTLVQNSFNVILVAVSSFWISRTFRRTSSLYQREKLSSRLRKQLRKLNLEFEKFLDGKSLDELSADEIYVLARVMPDFSREKRLQSYQGVLKEALEDGYVEPSNSLASLEYLRQELEISEQEHEAIMSELGQETPELFYPKRSLSWF